MIIFHAQPRMRVVDVHRELCSLVVFGFRHLCAVSAAAPTADLASVQMLFMVGPYLQAELGWRMFTALYFTAGVLANVAEYVGNVLLRCCRAPFAILSTPEH